MGWGLKSREPLFFEGLECSWIKIVWDFIDTSIWSNVNLIFITTKTACYYSRLRPFEMFVYLLHYTSFNTIQACYPTGLGTPTLVNFGTWSVNTGRRNKLEDRRDGWEIEKFLFILASPPWWLQRGATCLICSGGGGRVVGSVCGPCLLALPVHLRVHFLWSEQMDLKWVAPSSGARLDECKRRVSLAEYVSIRMFSACILIHKCIFCWKIKLNPP